MSVVTSACQSGLLKSDRWVVIEHSHKAAQSQEVSVVWTAGDSGKNTGSLWAYEHTSLWELLQLQLLRLHRRCFWKLSSLLVKGTFRQSSQVLLF